MKSINFIDPNNQITEPDGNDYNPMPTNHNIMKIKTQRWDESIS